MIVEKSVLSVNHSTESSASCDRASLHVHLLFSSAPSLWQGQHAAFSSNIRGTSPSYKTHHIGEILRGGQKSIKHLISCRVIAVLHCATPWVLAPRARLFHLLRQHLFHSAKIFYAKCSPAPLKLSAKSLLSPSCLASVAFFASQTP